MVQQMEKAAKFDWCRKMHSGKDSLRNANLHGMSNLVDIPWYVVNLHGMSKLQEDI